MGGEGRAGVGLCPWAARCVVWDDGAQTLSVLKQLNAAIREHLNLDSFVYGFGGDFKD